MQQAAQHQKCAARRCPRGVEDGSAIPVDGFAERCRRPSYNGAKKGVSGKLQHQGLDERRREDAVLLLCQAESATRQDRLGQSRQLLAGSGGRRLTRWTDRRGRGSAGQDDSGSVTSPAPEWDADSDVEHDRVGTGSKTIHGYVLEEPAAQSEGTCACNYNPLSAVVTVYGHQRHFERCCRYDAEIQYKPERCQLQ
jgi:hypothetical protein